MDKQGEKLAVVARAASEAEVMRLTGVLRRAGLSPQVLGPGTVDETMNYASGWRATIEIAVPVSQQAAAEAALADLRHADSDGVAAASAGFRRHVLWSILIGATVAATISLLTLDPTRLALAGLTIPAVFLIIAFVQSLRARKPQDDDD